MKRVLYKLFFFIVSSVMFFYGPLPLFAQEETESESAEFTLEEITVTAEKREMDLQKVSSSLAVISSDDLDIRSTNNVQDVLSGTAGVSFFGFQQQVFIRGIGSVDRAIGSEPSVQFNVDGNVSFNYEGRTTDPMLQSTNDVERVEVIRGPSGTVNGRMASAGTINVISKSPDFEKVDGNVKLTIGNYNTIRTSAAMNLPLKLTGLDLPSFLERLSFRVAMEEDKHEPYVHNADGEGVSGMQNYFTVRTKMKWQPVESLTVNASYTYTRDASNQAMMVPPIQGSPGVAGPGSPFSADAHTDDPWLNKNANKLGEVAANRQYNESLEINWKTGIGTFTGRYGYSWVPVECNAADEGVTCWSGDMGQKDYELRLNSPDESKITWMAGVYYFHKKEYTGPDAQLGVINPDTRISFQQFYGNDDKWTIPDLFDPGTWSGVDGYTAGSSGWSVNDTTAPWSAQFTPYLDALIPGEVAIFQSTAATRPIDAYSVYGNITYPFGENDRAVLGLRKNIEKKRRVTNLGVFGPTNDPSDPGYYGGYPHFTFEYNTVGDTTRGTWYCDNCELLTAEEPFEVETKDNPLSYQVGWEHDVNTKVMLYVTIKNGFKPGGISFGSIPAMEYKPQTTTNYALGLKGRFFDNVLQINAEAFYMSIKNYQQQVATQGELTRVVNGQSYTQPFIYNSETKNFGPMKNYGLDLDYDWLISPRDRIRGNVEYKEAKYGEGRFYLGYSGFPPGTPVWADYEGRPMPFAPKFTFFGAYSHMFTFGNYTVTPEFDASFSTKYFLHYEYWQGTINPDIWQPAYFKYDAYLSIVPTNEIWAVNAYVKNISEKVIRSSAFFVGTNIGEPRTFGASLKVNF